MFSRAEKIAVTGVIVTALGVIATVASPEIRAHLGLANLHFFEGQHTIPGVPTEVLQLAARVPLRRDSMNADQVPPELRGLWFELNVPNASESASLPIGWEFGPDHVVYMHAWDKTSQRFFTYENGRSLWTLNGNRISFSGENDDSWTGVVEGATIRGQWTIPHAIGGLRVEDYSLRRIRQ